MPHFIALLRAVNLGSHNKVSMAGLRAFAEKIGLEDVKTLLQSGNLVFRTDKCSTAAMEKTLESGASRQLGLQTDFFVRTAKEWQAIIAANPFPAEAKSDPGHMILMTLREAPSRQAVAELSAAIKGREIVQANGREAYFVYPDGMGRSRLTIALIERKLGTRGTARNWNTVLKVGALTSTG